MIVAAMLFAVALNDQFFIISSVDAAHGRVVMKQPSEVTTVLSVPSNARLRGEHGETLHLSDLRAGDTVFAVVTRSPDGQLIAASIRRGPMTLQELRRRYLTASP